MALSPWAMNFMQVNPDEVDLDYVLYTDCDVLFENDVNTCLAPPMPPVM